MTIIIEYGADVEPCTWILDNITWSFFLTLHALQPNNVNFGNKNK